MFQSKCKKRNNFLRWALGQMGSRGSVIETISIFLYVQPIFIDEKVLVAMNQNFKAIS